MPITPMEFSPTDDGYLNQTEYPANPANESEARSKMMQPLKQLQSYINETLLGFLYSAESEQSGAEQIGSAPIGGVEGATVYAQITALKALHDALAYNVSQLVLQALSLPDFGITTNLIDTAAVTRPKITAGAIGTAEIEDGTVTGAKLAAATIPAGKHVAKSIATADLADGLITSVKIGSNAIATGNIQVGAVNADRLASGAVTDVKIAGNAVTDAKIGNRTVTDTLTASGTATTLTNILGYLANMIKRITGETAWYTTPDTTIAALNTKIQNKVTVSTVAPASPAVNDIWIDIS